MAEARKQLGGKFAIKFGQINKASVRGKVKHSRTGACSAKLGRKCYHGSTDKYSKKG